jgi:hypothetical protein
MDVKKEDNEIFTTVEVKEEDKQVGISIKCEPQETSEDLQTLVMHCEPHHADLHDNVVEQGPLVIGEMQQDEQLEHNMDFKPYEPRDTRETLVPWYEPDFTHQHRDVMMKEEPSYIDEMNVCEQEVKVKCEQEETTEEHETFTSCCELDVDCDVKEECLNIHDVKNEQVSYHQISNKYDNNNTITSFTYVSRRVAFLKIEVGICLYLCARYHGLVPGVSHINKYD